MNHIPPGSIPVILIITNDFTGAEKLAFNNGYTTKVCGDRWYNTSYQRCCISVVFPKRFG